MKKIQLIVSNYMTNSCQNKYGEFMEINSISYPQSFDDYEINIFFLVQSDFFKFENGILKCKKDYDNISKMIKNCKKTSFIFILPNNIMINDYSYIKDYPKNVLDVLNNIYATKGLSIYYENTYSQLQNEKVHSCFAFSENDCYEPLVLSTSDKIVAIKEKKNKIYYTSLNIQTLETMLALIEKLGLLKLNSNIPKWLSDYNFFDDEEKKKETEKLKKQILKFEEKINSINIKLEENLKYKRILIDSGDNLVRIVFEMLKEMFDVSLDDFEDEQKEDFLFEKNDWTYIGEIKGVNESIKRKHVAQASSHCADYCDELDEQEIEKKNIKTLLIINYQRKIEVDKRHDIDKEVIKYAQKQEVLIIDSKTFLTLYEHIKSDIKSKKKILDLINSSVGLLNLDELNL